MYSQNQPPHIQQQQYYAANGSPLASPYGNGGEVDFFGGAVPQPPPPPAHDIQRTYSNHSNASSMGNRSASAPRPGEIPPVLDDKRFAPPPKRPHSLQTSKFATRDSRSLPKFDLVKHSGDCLARLSLKSMMTKKWRQTFWIAYGYSQILFFRSRSDFDEWISNPFLVQEERDELVKLNIDFKNHLHLDSVLGYKVSKVSSKAYRSDGYMHQFKVDKWYTYGPSVSAAVGSKKEMEVRNLRTIILAMMELYPQNVKDAQENDDLSVYGSSDASQYSSGSVHSSRSMGSSGNMNREQYQNVLGAQRPVAGPPPYHYDLGPQRLEQRVQSQPPTPPSYQYDLGRSAHSQPTKPHQYDLGLQASSKPASARFWKNKEQKIGSERMSGDPSKSKSKSLRQMFKRKKNPEQPQQVQYYVGRPSDQKAYQHAPSQVDYGM